MCVRRCRVTLIAVSLSVYVTARSMEGRLYAATICRAKYVQPAVSHSLKDITQAKTTRHLRLINCPSAAAWCRNSIQI